MAADTKKRVAETGRRTMLDPIDWIEDGAASLPDDVKSEYVWNLYADALFEFAAPATRRPAKLAA